MIALTSARLSLRRFAPLPGKAPIRQVGFGGAVTHAEPCLLPLPERVRVYSQHTPILATPELLKEMRNYIHTQKGGCQENSRSGFLAIEAGRAGSKSIPGEKRHRPGPANIFRNVGRKATRPERPFDFGHPCPTAVCAGVTAVMVSRPLYTARLCRPPDSVPAWSGRNSTNSDRFIEIND